MKRTLSFAVVFYLLLSAMCLGQQVASKDLSEFTPKPTRERSVPLPEGCPKNDTHFFISHSDGDIVRDHPEELVLEITSVEPRVLTSGQKIRVSIRLKNQGKYNALVPWNENEVEPAQADITSPTKSYESAVIELSLGAGDKKLRLTGEAWLHAAPNERRHLVELSPGGWIDLTFSGTVECGKKDKSSCQDLSPDPKAQLSATWLEWEFTERYEDCKLHTGAYKARDITSKPLQLVYLGKNAPLN